MRIARTGCALTLAALAGCAYAPPPELPVVAAPASYKAAEGWGAAAPADTRSRGDWWTAFEDPVLDELMVRLDRASPTVAAALARYEQARAAAGVAAAAQSPTLSGTASLARRKPGVATVGPAQQAASADYGAMGGLLSYEIDLWGRLRDEVSARRAEAAASAADLANMRLSLQATLADAYLRLRGIEAESALIDETVAAYERAHAVTVARHAAGAATGLDTGRSEVQLTRTRALSSDLKRRRSQLENQIAILVGEVPTSFILAPTTKLPKSPGTPASVPSELLQRRADVAAAERRVSAANARIGVARAAFFPSLTIDASAGLQSASGRLAGSPANVWALGPLAALAPLVDGGRRSAQLKISRSVHAEASAEYRETALAAFREVEDALAARQHLTEQTADLGRAATAAARTQALALSAYDDGASDYLEVVTAQTAALETQRAELAARTANLQAFVALVRALGGGVEASPSQVSQMAAEPLPENS